jgi:hypothetical protein
MSILFLRRFSKNLNKSYLNTHLFTFPLLFLLVFVVALGLVDSVVDKKQKSEDVFEHHPREESEYTSPFQKPVD